MAAALKVASDTSGSADRVVRRRERLEKLSSRRAQRISMAMVVELLGSIMLWGLVSRSTAQVAAGSTVGAAVKVASESRETRSTARVVRRAKGSRNRPRGELSASLRHCGYDIEHTTTDRLQTQLPINRRTIILMIPAPKAILA